MTIGPQQLAKESHSCEAVTLCLNEDIDDHTVLIYSTPEIMPGTVDLQEHLIQMPLVSGPGAPSPQASGEQMPELLAPLARAVLPA